MSLGDLGRFSGPLSRFRPPRPVAPLLASAVLLGLAFPPFHLLFPSFLALVPYAVWVGRLPGGGRGASMAMRGGFWMGLVGFSLILYWLVISLIYYTPLAVFAFLVPVLAIAGFLALATLGIHGAVRRLGWPLWVALPVFWTAVEWTRAHLGDISFPWMGLGESLTGYPALMGGADLVGARGLSFWLAAVNGLIAESLLSWSPAWLERWMPTQEGWRSGGSGRDPGRDGRDRWDATPGSTRQLATLGVALGLFLTLPISYSVYRWVTLDPRPAVRVAVLQPNIPEDLKLRPQAAIDSTVTSVRTLVREGLDGRPEGAERGRDGPADGTDGDGEDGGPSGLDLVLLPEATFPAYLDPIPERGYPGAEGIRAWAARLAGRLGAPVLFGGVGVRDRPGEGFDYFNSTFLVDGTGRELGRYHKRRPVPVVERVPFVEPAWFQGWFEDVFGPFFGGQSVGPPPEPLSAGGVRFGVLICYESIFADLSRAYRRDGVDVLVNVTNDAWYGREGPWWNQTSALWQHPAHLVARAIENRVGIARSANTGISGIVDPLGRWSHRTPLFEPAAFRATVSSVEGTTVYAKIGDVTGWGAALAAFGAALALWLRSRRRRGEVVEREPNGRRE